MTDNALQYLIDLAQKNKKIIQLILFGSRARGDHSPRSDYDVAVKAELNHDDWSNWAVHVRENFPSLCGLDLIQLDQSTSSDLREKIRKDGKIIYEQN